MNGYAIKTADDPLLRGLVCVVEEAPTEQAFLKTPAPWQPATPQNVKGDQSRYWSAVAYFMARKLRADLKVPVGIMMASCGATPAQRWSAPEGSEFAPKAKIDPGINTMYNAMIRPLIPYGIRGAIWYQGENNVRQAGETGFYEERFKALVGGWRKVWGQGDFPVYAVELAPCSWYSDAQLGEWCEAMIRATKKIPNTGLAVSNDLTIDYNDIHPVRKKEPGERLALLALGQIYGAALKAYSSPIYESLAVEGSTLKLKFSQVGDGIKSRDGQPLTGFEIAGAEFDPKTKDYKFFPAEATAAGDTVTLRSDAVATPITARYAWKYNARNNAVNSEGLPVNTFRTKRPPLSVMQMRGWTATASSQNSPHEDPKNAVDGVGSIWVSWICKPFGGGTKDAPLDAWLSVNFGKDKLTLKGVKIAALGGGEAHVLVQIPDGESWKTIGEYKGKGDTSPVIPFARPAPPVS